MSPIWANGAGGSVGLNPDGSVALVRAWTYRKQLSDCPPLPATIVIIACNPPDCVEFTNTNLSPYGRVYVRESCAAWGGSGGYAWPDDVPNCPYPNGITIDEVECDGTFTQLRVDVEGEGFSIIPVGDYNDPGWLYPPIVAYGALTRSGSGWSYICYQAGSSLEAWVHLAVNCAGDVYYENRRMSQNLRRYQGNGATIALDAEDLPIGESVIPVYSYGQLNPLDFPDGFFGNLTITVSKV